MQKFLTLLLIVGFHGTGAQQFTQPNYTSFNGFFNFHYEEAKDRILLEVDELNKEFLYVYALSTGLGSNDIGLDRGQLGNEQVVKFQKTGNKLLLIQPNLYYRAMTDNALEKKSIQQAFAESVIGGFEIIEEKKGSYLIDFTSFLKRDAHGVIDILKSAGQGHYQLDPNRCAIALQNTRSFPKNTEFEAMLTFEGKAEGREIRSVAPNPNALTVTQHHSFLELPDANYEPRIFDPRSGNYPFMFTDYATPIDQPITKRFIYRHRLKKKNPGAAMSEAENPIVYYLDAGTPEPVRSALLDGARWWNEAFEAVGYKNAFQVKMLPAEADPLDVRYHVIQWVHRSTRGWSYGASVSDPRTGEIIKGHVSLGSLRVRQDFLITQGLSRAPFRENDEAPAALLDLALARIRQLSAHEVGHTLGFAHNFAASTNDRASVMDYPHPYIGLGDEGLDFSQAYDVGIGEWDKLAVAFAYGDNPGQAIQTANEKDFRMITDSDARPASGAHARAHLWDNGMDAVAELDRVMDVRTQAIQQFSAYNIRSTEPYAVLEDVFVPIYFFHRYQAEAAVKLIGGLDYNYALRGDGTLTNHSVDGESQRQAVKVLLKTLDAEALTIPEHLLPLFPPRAPGHGLTRESFKSQMGVAFDPIGAASTASDQVLRLMLHPARANRLVLQQSRDTDQLGLTNYLNILLTEAFVDNPSATLQGQVQMAVNVQLLRHLVQLGADKGALPITQAVTKKYLDNWKKQLKPDAEGLVGAHHQYCLDLIEGRIKVEDLDVPAIPDGSPIGTERN